VLVERGLMLVTAESCTGGMIAARCTDLPGSSRWFERGLVTYSNAAKTELLGVATTTLDRHGAVSEQTAAEMARGALAASRADLAVAVTGVAGPDGGSEDKPVGTVWFGFALRGGTTRTERHVFDGDRAAVREATVERALAGLIDLAADG